jgi:hypothetical protein
MLGSGRADPAETICARRRQWFLKRADDLGKDRMGTHSHCYGIESGGHDVGNDLAFRQDDRERSRPEMIHQSLDQSMSLRRDIGNLL